MGPRSNISTLSMEDLDSLSNTIMKLLEILHNKNQPYNLMIRNSVVHIVPRQIENKSDGTIFGPAFFELYGILIVKTD